MDEELLKLASTAGNTVVALLATETWQTAKTAMVGLWNLVQPQRADAIAGEIDDARDDLLSALRDGNPTVGDELSAEWRGRLRRLLVANPGVAEELKRLLTEELLPATRQSEGHSVTQHVRAYDNSRVYVSGHDLHLNERP